MRMMLLMKNIVVFFVNYIFFYLFCKTMLINDLL